MQNITSRYNYLYNAQGILAEYHSSYVNTADAHHTAELDKVISKAQFIISDKKNSKYLPDAYLLLAEANFLKGNYFLSKAYFDYVARTYKKNTNHFTKALDGSARSLLQLDKPEQAAPLLDSLKAQLPLLKKHKANLLITLAQGSIQAKDYPTAITYIEAALRENSSKQQKHRWSYTLAQLYRAENNDSTANDYFKKLDKRFTTEGKRATSPLANASTIATTLEDPDKRMMGTSLPVGNTSQTENTSGKNFNTLAARHRKKGYFTYEQQQLSPILQQPLPETPLKNLPLTAAKNEKSTVTTAKKTVIADNIFGAKPADSYYFVIAVSDATINLNPSRFGIGEFNRGNFAPNGLRHRLTEFDNDQLIYIGNFSNFEAVNLYAEVITPLLKQIMKTQATSYNSFIISKENFEKINSKELLSKYLEFYKNNFLK